MNEWGVSNKQKQALEAQMGTWHIEEHDLKERFVRSSGRGGQNVNKVATCVYLRHIPTGLSVKCQQERSQGLNRFRAREILVKKIRERQEALEHQAMARILKQRRQRRERSQEQKEIVLEKKRKRSQTKAARRSILAQKVDEYL